LPYLVEREPNEAFEPHGAHHTKARLSRVV
jgi:hypothetical protein